MTRTMSILSMSIFLLTSGVYVIHRVDGSSLNRINILAKGLENNNGMTLALCTNQAARALFRPKNPITTIIDGEESDVARNYLKILSNEVRSVILIDSISKEREKFLSSSSWPNSNPESSYVIISNDLDNLKKIFRNESISSIWSEYLIVVRSDQDSLNAFASSMWENGYPYFAILHTEPNSSSTTLLRYEKSSETSAKCKNRRTLKQVAKCKETPTDSGNEMFDDAIKPLASELCPASGCTLVVGHVDDDMVGSSSIAKIRRNFDCAENVLNYFVDIHGIRLKKATRYGRNVNWTTALKLIERNEIDVAYGNFVPRIEGLDNLDPTIWYDFATVTFLDASKFLVVAPPTKIFVPLDSYIWGCLGMLLIIYSIFAIVVQKLFRRRIINNKIKIFHIWTILLNQAIKPPTNCGLRIVLGMWMFLVICINIAYGSAFSSSLAIFTKVNSLKTLFDLNKSGKSIVGSAVARQLFNNSDDQTDREICEKWIVVKPEEVFEMASKDRVVGADYFVNLKLHNIYNHGKSKRHLYDLEERILVHPLQFYLKKNHPYIKALRRLVIRARAADLIDKWRFWKTHNAMIRAQIRYFHYPRNSHGRRLDDLSVSFKVWGIGILISSITFLYEIYTNKCVNSCTDSMDEKRPKSLTGNMKMKIFILRKIVKK